MKVLICDDEQNDIDIIKNDLKDYDFEIDCTNDLTNVKNNYDIVLMDIELNQEKNGIDYVKELFSNSEVIYITGYSNYCTKVYESNHIYFLLKPYDKNDFNNAINKALNNINDKRKNILNIKNKDKSIKIMIDSINYIESEKRKISIFTDKKCYSTYNTIKNIMTYLPKHFIVCHNSFIVNLKKVSEINKNSFIMNNDIVIPISQNKYKKSKDEFLNVIGGIHE